LTLNTIKQTNKQQTPSEALINVYNELKKYREIYKISKDATHNITYLIRIKGTPVQ
jgi:hypothetical protein